VRIVVPNGRGDPNHRRAHPSLPRHAPGDLTMMEPAQIETMLRSLENVLLKLHLDLIELKQLREELEQNRWR